MYDWLIASIRALKKGLTGELGERFEMGSDIGEKMGEKMGEERRAGERETAISRIRSPRQNAQGDENNFSKY